MHDSTIPLIIKEKNTKFSLSNFIATFLALLSLFFIFYTHNEWNLKELAVGNPTTECQKCLKGNPQSTEENPLKRQDALNVWCYVGSKNTMECKSKSAINDCKSAGVYTAMIWNEQWCVTEYAFTGEEGKAGKDDKLMTKLTEIVETIKAAYAKMKALETPETGSLIKQIVAVSDRWHMEWLEKARSIPGSDSLTDKLKDKKYEKFLPLLVISYGPMGAGKSTFAKRAFQQLGINEGSYINVDTDQYLEDYLMYLANDEELSKSTGLGLTEQRASLIVASDSLVMEIRKTWPNDMKTAAINTAATRKKNVLIETTGKSLSTNTDVVEKLFISNGFHVHVVYALVPKSESRKRILKRALEGQAAASEKSLQDALEKGAWNFLDYIGYKNPSPSRTFWIIDNSGKKGEETQLESKEAFENFLNVKFKGDLLENTIREAMNNLKPESWRQTVDPKRFPVLSKSKEANIAHSDFHEIHPLS